VLLLSWFAPFDSRFASSAPAQTLSCDVFLCCLPYVLCCVVLFTRVCLFAGQGFGRRFRQLAAAGGVGSEARQHQVHVSALRRPHAAGQEGHRRNPLRQDRKGPSFVCLRFVLFSFFFVFFLFFFLFFFCLLMLVWVFDVLCGRCLLLTSCVL
jgi:hypothetical protein